MNERQTIGLEARQAPRPSPSFNNCSGGEPATIAVARSKRHKPRRLTEDDDAFASDCLGAARGLVQGTGEGCRRA